MKVWLIDLCNKDETFFTTFTVTGETITEIGNGIILDDNIIKIGDNMRISNIVEKVS